MGFACPCGEYPMDHDEQRARDCLASLVCYVEEEGRLDDAQAYFEGDPRPKHGGYES